MIAALLLALAHAYPACNRAPKVHRGHPLDAAYAPDHANYLCMNYTRPTPLPCAAPSKEWKPRWFMPRKRFVVTAWWPPNPKDYAAYADAGFNLALTENYLTALCMGRTTVTHDEVSASREKRPRGAALPPTACSDGDPFAPMPGSSLLQTSMRPKPSRDSA